MRIMMILMFLLGCAKTIPLKDNFNDLKDIQISTDLSVQFKKYKKLSNTPLAIKIDKNDINQSLDEFLVDFDKKSNFIELEFKNGVRYIYDYTKHENGNVVASVRGRLVSYRGKVFLPLINDMFFNHLGDQKTSSIHKIRIFGQTETHQGQPKSISFKIIEQ